MYFAGFVRLDGLQDVFGLKVSGKGLQGSAGRFSFGFCFLGRGFRSSGRSAGQGMFLN